MRTHSLLLFFIAFLFGHNPPSSCQDYIVDTDRVYFAEQRPYAFEMYSDPDDAVDQEQGASFEALLTTLLENKKMGLKIAGFADLHECQMSECSDLSLRRAKLVFFWLRKRGIPIEQLAGPTGEGTEYALYPSDDYPNREFNRRVQCSAFTIPRVD